MINYTHINKYFCDENVKILVRVGAQKCVLVACACRRRQQGELIKVKSRVQTTTNGELHEGER